MAGISSKAMGKLENKKKYNGIEFENDLDLNVYDAFYRELDPQTGRWWQIDPEIENMEAWSPYASNYNNPITFSDPLGDEPDDGGCCGALIDAVKDVGRKVIIGTAAALNSWSSNQIGGAGRVDINQQGGLTDGDQVAAKVGQMVGDAAAIVTGIGEIALAGAGEIASVGVATPVAVVVGAHGVSSIAMGGINLIKGAAKQTGSYTNSHQSGKTYSGKGAKERAKESGNRVAKEHKDPVKKNDWKPSKNTREAFKAEDKRIQKTGGAGSPKNYNKINSPGRKYNEKDKTLNR